MNYINQKKHKHISVNTLFLYMLTGWTIIILGLAYWAYVQVNNETYSLANKEGIKSFEKDLIFRHWATMHGGVYVPITPETQSNPYLIVKERDIETPSGKKLTLMNPAYMTRQLNEIAKKKYNILSHITSLNPIRPENIADDWEMVALKEFEKGVKDYKGFDTIDGLVYFRYMAPLKTEQGCLKCHASQGYKVGEIRGGLSTSIPWANYEESIKAQDNNLYLRYSLLWLVGALGINIVRLRFKKYVKEKKLAEEYQEQLLNDLSESNNLIEANLFEKNSLIEELIYTKESLEKANQEKDKFFSIIAHDLKNPIANFKQVSELLLESYSDLPEDEKLLFLNLMQDSSKNIYSLLENLLEWSRSQRGTIKFSPEYINFKNIVDNTIQILSLSAKNKNISFEYLLEVEEVFADANLLTTIIRNLCSNSIKFTPENGKIVISNFLSENFVEICIEDNGIGMSQETISKLFRIDVNVSTLGTSNEKGTGLGLILCKEFIEMHKGKIRVESTPNIGTKFFISLPIY